MESLILEREKTFRCGQEQGVLTLHLLLLQFEGFAEEALTSEPQWRQRTIVLRFQINFSSTVIRL
jgi:hypothetical protein